MRAPLSLLIFLAGALLLPGEAIAQTGPAATPTSDLLRTGLLLTALAVVPAVFISMTSFIRIAVVLSMIRHAFGMPETPPNAVLVSLAIFLTAFVMGPTFTALNTGAIQPLLANKIDLETALKEGSAPLRDFMLAQTRDEDIAAVYRLAGEKTPETPQGVDILKLAPAFILNELRVSFTIGFVILLPFLLIEIVVASILLSLGMMMVPPATISLPIKLLMFVMIDGWALVLEGVIGSFR
ncbi:MAG TPA: flagellar type III secretion system pore protein FliP [Hyphomonadaceae bacterium]|nr:flagellar type III secretion system pore protein FliP [Hyphomonadaceae bacterium]